MPTHQITRILPDLPAIARAAAPVVAGALAEGLASRGRASILLAGGTTPRELYEELARAHHDDLHWAEVDVYWGDERLVRSGDPHRNDRMAREALLDAIGADPPREHPMPAAPVDPDQAAHAYEHVLRSTLGDDRFDVVLLGVGDDGHTASLFPGCDALDDTRRWVRATSAPAEPRQRLTCTFPALFRARAIHVLAAGAGKADALRRIWSGEPVATCPAAALRRAPVPVTWWMDAAAAPPGAMTPDQSAGA